MAGKIAPWKKSKIPRGFWNSFENQKLLFRELEQELNIQCMEDWYKLSTKSLYGAYKKYQSNIQMLKTIFPNYFWVPWKFSIVPQGCWDDYNNRRQCFNEVLSRNGFKFMNDFYSLKYEQILNHSGISVFQKYESNLFYSLIHLYPEISWVPWSFEKVPQNFWDSIENQKLYLKSIEKNLNINTMEDWYNVPVKKIAPVYKQYFSVLEMLKTLFPNYSWFSWKFCTVSAGCWKNTFNCRQYLDNLGLSLNFKLSPEDWYLLKNSDVYKHGGPSLLSNYKSNLMFCFTNLYPEINWLPWNFMRISSNFWQKKENIFEFLNWCENHFNLKCKNDWYFITHEQIRIIGGNSLLKKYGGIQKLIENFYPNYNWDRRKLNSTGKTQQQILNFLSILFPDKKISLNFKHSNIVFKNTNKKIELDIYIPALNLAFEYQGQHHYDSVTVFGNTNIQKERDQEKRKLCRENFISLIEIPFTWDGDLYSLKQIIKKERPDIILQN